MRAATDEEIEEWRRDEVGHTFVDVERIRRLIARIDEERHR